MFPQNLNGIGGPPAYLVAYDNMFKVLYNQDPVIDTPDMGTILRGATNLLEAAENLDSAYSVRRTIESIFLREGAKLSAHITKHPDLWSDPAIRLQSPRLFRESFCHLVGAWRLRNYDESLATRKKGIVIRKLALQKVETLDGQKQEIDKKLIGFYPEKMMHLPGSNADGRNPGRVVYAADIYDCKLSTSYDST